ncbi:MAG TPA: UbiA family prenyltransferase [Streptomyces sp.]|nr:UbiA family prenyltransferase [Streptomyces sp.]
MTTYSTEPPLGIAEFTALTPDERVRAARCGRGTAGPAETARILLMLGRPRTCVPGLLAFSLGWTVAGPAFDGRYVLGLVLTLAYGLLANLYNAHTDLEEDSRNLPGRVWLLLRAGDRRVVAAGHLLSLTILATAPLYGADYLVAAVLALIGAHQYSYPPLRLKARPVAGLFAFSLAVIGPFALGYCAGPHDGRAPGGEVWALAAFLTVWFVAKGMVKNLPDHDGDRAAGLRTSATVFPDRAAAARAATATTLVGYLSLPLLVLGGALPALTLLALPWAVLAYAQCRAMAEAPDAATANQVLKRDMLLSTAFLATLLVLNEPGWATGFAVALGAAVLLGSDRVALDSRRSEDVRNRPADGPTPTTPRKESAA